MLKGTVKRRFAYAAFLCHLPDALKWILRDRLQRRFGDGVDAAVCVCETVLQRAEQLIERAYGACVNAVI